jgi:hypothetical protein
MTLHNSIIYKQYHTCYLNTSIYVIYDSIYSNLRGHYSDLRGHIQSIHHTVFVESKTHLYVMINQTNTIQ